MKYKDYYKILDIDKNATPDEIKNKYRRLARKYHPDVSKEPNAEEKFKEVKEAYEVLNDPEKRKAYDQMGNQWQQGEQFRPPPGWEFHQTPDNGDQFTQEGFSEFFENLFGHRTRQHARHYDRTGEDQHSKISLSLAEAFQGTERMIQLQEPEIDAKTGEVRYKSRTLKVKIPAGVTEGQHIRLAGLGSKGIGNGRNGDLYLEIHLENHPYYTLKDRDIYLNLPVTPWEAALGSKIEVPTLAGNVVLTIPEGSQTGTKLRLKGRGLPGHPTGDQYIILTIYTPAPNTESQRQLYQKMAEEMQYNPRISLLNKSA